MNRGATAILVLCLTAQIGAWSIPGSSLVSGLFPGKQEPTTTTTTTTTTSTTTSPPPSKEPSKGGWGFGSIVDKTKDFTSGIISSVGNAASNAIDKVKDVAGSAIDLTLKVTESAVNKSVNIFLKQFSLLVKTLKIDSLPLPSISLSPFYIFSFKADNGYFKSLSSLSKDGDISIKRNGTSMEVYVPLKFDDMEIGYKNYSAEAFRMGMEGSMSVGVKANKLSMRLRINLSTKCAIALEDVDFFEVEGIEVKLTGLCRLCDSLSSKIASYVTQMVQSKIKNIIKDKVGSLLETVLSDSSMICANFVSG